MKNLVSGNIQMLQVVHNSMPRDLSPLVHYRASSPLRTLCLSCELVRSFENIRCLTGVKVLAVTQAMRMDLNAFVELTGLRALSLAGLRSAAPMDRAAELFKPLSGLTNLR